jgi:predicted lipoprotein with Yx(FWY)xxD motif
MRAPTKALLPTLAVSLLLSACGSSSSSSGSAAPSSQPAATATTGASSSAVVKTASNSKLGGTILVDAQGLTLYRLSGEQNGKFICTSTTCLELAPAHRSRRRKPDRHRWLAQRGQAPRRQRAGDLQSDAALHIRRRPLARADQRPGDQGRQHLERRHDQHKQDQRTGHHEHELLRRRLRILSRRQPATRAGQPDNGHPPSVGSPGRSPCRSRSR